MSRIFVTGMGIISPLGSDLSANHLALQSGASGITSLSLVDSRFSGVLPCGEIKISTGELKQQLAISDQGVTRTSLLALHAFREAVRQSQLSIEQVRDEATAFINSTTVGGICLTNELYHDANADDQGSEFLESYDFASVALFIQRAYQMKGIVNTIHTACSSSANAIGYGGRLIGSGAASRAIVGGVDSLAKFTINGFNALHILSPEACLPFDEYRQGLNLGEGAAYLVLEKQELVGDKKVYAELVGFGNANDAFHASSLSEQGDGPFLAMEQALESSGLRPKDIDFINAHGTATENNDRVESRAMIRLFGKPPAFASTKGFIGHTLGAAGAIEAVFSILSLWHQEGYSNLGFREPIRELELVPMLGSQSMSIKHIMSNSFGFGGNCSSLIFSTP